jgi:DNA-binding MarR family transcriptional regulator
MPFKPPRRSSHPGTLSNGSPKRTTLLDDLPFYLAGLDLAFRGLLERMRLEAKANLEFRPGMGSIFFALCEQDDCIIKELVARLKIPNSTVTSLLDAMERSGILERHDCPDDGRAYRVRLTPAGRALEPAMRERHQSTLDILQAGLSEGDVRELKRLLAHLLTNLRRHEEHWRLARRRERVALLAHRRLQRNGKREHVFTKAPRAEGKRSPATLSRSN